MTYNILLVVVLWCSLGLSNTNTDSDNVLENTQVDNTQGVGVGGVQCWECTIQKSLDNQIIGMWDDVTHAKINTGYCKNYPCAANQDWCLVTHYRVRSTDGAAESKREKHECGNSNQRERDMRCQAILNEDREHQVIDSCTTKRSGASSLFTVYISSAIALIMLYIH